MGEGSPLVFVHTQKWCIIWEELIQHQSVCSLHQWFWSAVFCKWNKEQNLWYENLYAFIETCPALESLRSFCSECLWEGFYKLYYRLSLYIGWNCTDLSLYALFQSRIDLIEGGVDLCKLQKKLPFLLLGAFIVDDVFNEAYELLISSFFHDVINRF